MTAIIKSIRKFENQFDDSAERFTFRHPYLAFAAMFVGMPIFILSVVTASTTLIALPVAWIFGWL